jgi:hypothetical protein
MQVGMDVVRARAVAGLSTQGRVLSMISAHHGEVVPSSDVHVQLFGVLDAEPTSADEPREGPWGG